MSLTSNVRVEWIAAVTIAAGTAAIGYLAYKKFYVKDHRNKTMVNLHIQKDDPKVVHAFDMEDLGDKAVYCRCWRSKKVNVTIFLTKEEKEISLFTRKDFLLKWILASAIPQKDVCNLNTETEEFPFCDGAHTKHNEETGDNVGPLIIKRKET